MLLYPLPGLRDPRRNLYIPIVREQFLPFVLYTSLCLLSIPQCTVNIALCRAARHVVALVIKLFTLAQSKLHLDTRPFKIKG